MGTKYSKIEPREQDLIAAQKIFFVGTATADSRVNISPKGMDTFKVLDPNRVIWLNVTGSGNETAAHVMQNPRMTVMFAAFEGRPVILRLYGTARAVHHNDPDWDELYAHFNPLPGARQVFDMTVDLVQTSCGMAVPFFDYVEEREQLNDHFTKKGEDGTKAYWEKKNQHSIDGLPTDIVARNIS